jgi:hypothetical protein
VPFVNKNKFMFSLIYENCGQNMKEGMDAKISLFSEPINHERDSQLEV